MGTSVEDQRKPGSGRLMTERLFWQNEKRGTENALLCDPKRKAD